MHGTTTVTNESHCSGLQTCVTLNLNGTIKGKTPLDFDVKLQCTSCRYESTAVDICNISQM